MNVSFYCESHKYFRVNVRFAMYTSEMELSCFIIRRHVSKIYLNAKSIFK
jgi:hypothetical protein